jgi:mannose-6-phosphate isomerase-like protein (cupin superfamily)
MTDPPYVRNLKRLLTSETHNVKNFRIGMVTIQPGGKSSPHAHEKNEEAWIVVEGRGEMVIAGEKEKIEPGIIVYAAPGEMHQLFNTSYEPLKAYYIMSRRS